jgi:hypothetical protein
MVLAADYPLLNIVWTMLIFFAFVVWIWLIVVLLSNVFGRRDIGGGTKALWTIFMIALPFIGVITYVALNHDQLAKASAPGIGKPHPNGAAATGPAAEIQNGLELFERGVITQSEFDSIKAHALST